MLNEYSLVLGYPGVFALEYACNNLIAYLFWHDILNSPNGITAIR